MKRIEKQYIKEAVDVYNDSKFNGEMQLISFKLYCLELEGVKITDEIKREITKRLKCITPKNDTHRKNLERGIKCYG